MGNFRERMLLAWTQELQKDESTSGSRVPKTRAEFWAHKFAANRLRDAKKCTELRRMGYRVLIIWECELFNIDKVNFRLRQFCISRQHARETGY
jgi:G:T-mismatch repair DNA endonuclease (very short patch repair protein)